MPFSKAYGPVTISEADGIATVAASLSESVGGGSVAGVVKASAQVNLQVSALQLADAGLLILESKFPSLAAEIGLVKSALDAEAAKL